jgi:coenzyme PQQ precursor peptide PqqA
MPYRATLPVRSKRGAAHLAEVGWLNDDIQAIASQDFMESTMAWTTPTLVEICIGLEINGYLPAEF